MEAITACPSLKKEYHVQHNNNDMNSYCEKINNQKISQFKENDFECIASSVLSKVSRIQGLIEEGELRSRSFISSTVKDFGFASYRSSIMSIATQLNILLSPLPEFYSRKSRHGRTSTCRT